MQIEGLSVSVSDILHVLEIFAIVGGGGTVAYKLGKTHSAIEAAISAANQSTDRQAGEIADLKHEIKKLGDVLTALAVQSKRLDMLEKWIDELRHGEGFALGPFRGAYETPPKR